MNCIETVVDFRNFFEWNDFAKKKIDGAWDMCEKNSHPKTPTFKALADLSFLFHFYFIPIFIQN